MKSSTFNLILKTIKSTFSLSGRASRREFIVFHLLYFFDVLLLLYTDKYYNSSSNSILIVILTIFYFISFILLIFPLFSLIIRRLHDLNSSGWWLLITLIPLGGLLYLALPFKKGTQGLNKYGPPPEY